LGDQIAIIINNFENSNHSTNQFIVKFVTIEETVVIKIKDLTSYYLALDIKVILN